MGSVEQNLIKSENKDKMDENKQNVSLNKQVHTDICEEEK